MKKRSLTLFSLAFAASLALFSCGKDDVPNADDPAGNGDGLPTDETWVVFNGNADWSGGIYALRGDKARKISLAGKPFYQLGYSGGGRVADGTLYKLNGNTNTEFGITKFAIDGAQAVTNAGFLATPDNTYETNTLIASATEGYYWNLGAGGLKVQTVNPSTMQRTGELDFSSLADGISSYETAGQLVLAKRGDKLYVDVQHGTRTQAWQVMPKAEKVEIAIVLALNLWLVFRHRAELQRTFFKKQERWI